MVVVFDGLDFGKFVDGGAGGRKSEDSELEYKVVVEAVRI